MRQWVGGERPITVLSTMADVDLAMMTGKMPRAGGLNDQEVAFVDDFREAMKVVLKDGGKGSQS